MAFDTTQPQVIQNDGFNSHNEKFNFSPVFLITFLIHIKLTVSKLISHPNINAYIPYFGIKKYIKLMFISELSRLVLNIKTCSPRPFRIPENVTCKYVNGQDIPIKNKRVPSS